jgi:glyoxylase-like metal-dependent hydrolase (beta-lactamase superfamily II)
MKIKSFFHPQTFTLSYIAYDDKTKDAVLIDSVVDYDPKSSTLSFKSAQIMYDFIKENDLKIHYLMETHAHADHLSGIDYMKSLFPNAKTAISENIKVVQDVFGGLFENNKNNDGSDFDVLLTDNGVVEAGSLKIKTIATPGHTPACMSFLVNEEALFTGDLLFAPDYGTGRCDFPGGDSKAMYSSIQKIYKLEDNIQVYPGHDYMPGGRIVWDHTSLAEHKNRNVHIQESTTEDEFTNFRNGRDSGLAAPNLLLQSVQFNAWAAKFKNGETKFLKMPLRIKE